MVEHGLENTGGSNHCFLNVVIQALWNLQSFRRRLLGAPEHPHALRGRRAEVRPPLAPGGMLGPMDCGLGCCGAVALRRAGTEEGKGSSSCQPPEAAEVCCFCALKSLLAQYQASEESVLPPDVLRRALSRVYVARGRFQLGDMEDATETIEALLDVLHAGSVRPVRERAFSAESELERVEEASRFGCHPVCIAHEVFGLEYVDLTRCAFCGATGEPTVASSFLYRAYVAELLASHEAHQAAAAPASSGASSFLPDAVLLRLSARRAGSGLGLQEALRGLCQREVAQKCQECNSLHTVFTERWLTQQPFTFVISLVWPCSTPTRDMLWLILSMIRPNLRMEQIFRTARGGRAAAGRAHGAQAAEDGPAAGAAEGEPPQEYALRGLICYYGMHYVALFWCWSRMKWILFDDTRVREEQDWSSVIHVIMCGLYVPTLVFYERTDRDSGILAPAASVEELARQIAGLEDREAPCAFM